MTTQYTREWLRTQEGVRPWGERALLAALAHTIGVPGQDAELVDFGCGDGYLCRAFAQMGGIAYGYDIAVDDELAAEQPPDVLLFGGDLGVPRTYRHSGRANEQRLVVSWETGEHLAADVADVFVANVAAAVGPGNWLVFTAAAVGQGGDWHINCQPQEYWRSRFEAQGVKYEPLVTEQLRETWKWVTGPCSWYPQNVQVFRRPE